MGEWVQWEEPYGPLAKPVVCRMRAADVVAEMRAYEPRYDADGRSDDDVLDDFCAVHWATRIQVEDTP